jgi:DNA-binding IclR family transcriptional regulator
MPRRSNTTARVMAVLEFLAAHPTDAFGLSELARELKISKATLLTVVTTLLEGGWLLQHPTRRTYSLGPTLIGTGHAALMRFPDTRLLQPAMESVAAEWDVGCVAVGVADGQMAVLSRTGFADPLHGLTRIGVRMDFAPPFGLSLAAWYPPERFQLWIDAANPPLSDEELVSLRQAVRTAHERGFVVGADLPDDHPLDRTLREQRFEAAGPDAEVLREFAGELRRVGYHLNDLNPEMHYRVNHVAAPVRSTSSIPRVALFVPMYGRSVRGDQLTRMGLSLARIAQKSADEHGI